MASILHIEDDMECRDIVKDILSLHNVVGAKTVSEAKELGEDFDLFICDSGLNRPFDGLLFATDLVSRGNKVIILANSHKFKRIPFFHKGLLTSKREEFVQLCDDLIKRRP